MEASVSTKLLIISQETSPVLDVSGNGQTIGNFDLYNDPIVNPGWTSSLPYFYEFNYTDFSSTTGLELVGTEPESLPFPL